MTMEFGEKLQELRKARSLTARTVWYELLHDSYQIRTSKTAKTRGVAISSF